MHEKREALDAIELLKLFAKHRGLSIELTTDDSSSDQQSSTEATENLNESHSSDEPMPIEPTSKYPDELATERNATNEVIQTQPASPVNQLPNPANDKQLIEQSTPISMKKTTSDI